MKSGGKKTNQNPSFGGKVVLVLVLLLVLVLVSFGLDFGFFACCLAS